MPWRGPQYEGEVPTLGYDILDWITEYLVVPDGPAAGEPLELTEEQAQFVLNFYRVDPNFRGPAVVGRSMRNARLINRAILCRPKGWGKSPLLGALGIVESVGDVILDGWDADGEPVARPWTSFGFKAKVQVLAVSEDQPLALDTPVATPDGWSTVGELRTGDKVFAADGHPVTVARTTRVMRNLPCYRVTFDDGEAIVASAGHGWTMSRAGRHDSSIRETVTVTTEELARDYLSSSGRRQYRVGSAAFSLPSIELPVDPYLLGLWLGDGSSQDSTICFELAHKDEVQGIVEPLLRDYEVAVWAESPRDGTGTFRIRRRQGMCPFGHEGDRTTSSSRCRACDRDRKRPGFEKAPRLETFRERLRGIGVLGNKHIPALYLRAGTEQRRALLQGLIDSDGHVTAKGRASFTNVNARLAFDVEELVSTLGYKVNTQVRQGVHRVFFVPGDEQPVARLAYKRSAQAPWSSRSTSRWRYVTDVRAVPSVPVRCIGINTPDHLFLAGRRAVPTHNTENTWDPLLDMVIGSPGLIDDYHLDPKETFISGPRLRLEYATSAGDSREGGRPVAVLADQTESWRRSNGGQRLAAAVRRNLTKTQGVSIESPNAFIPGDGSVAEASFKAAELQEARAKRNPSYRPTILKDHRGAPETVDIYDEKSLKKGLAIAYGDSADVNGGWVNLDRVVEDFWDPDSTVEDSRRFFLNQITAAADSWLSQLEVDAVNVPHAGLDVPPIAAGQMITLGFDGSRGRKKGVTDSTALIGCRVSDGHLFELGVWEQPKDWPKNTVWEPPVAEVVATVAKAFKTYKVAGFYGDPSKWESYFAKWEARYGTGDQIKAKASAAHPFTWWMAGQRSSRSIAAFKTFKDAVLGKALTFDGSIAIRRHLLNARMVVRAGGIWIEKKHPDSEDKIDVAIAAVLAYQARLDAIAAGALKPPRRTRRAPIRKLR